MPPSSLPSVTNPPSLGGVSPLRRELTPDIHPVPGSAPIIDFVASDHSLDRYNEVIVASGWRLDNYRKNPVIQNAHQYGDILFTIGKAVVTDVRGDHLYQRIEFATDINPMARIAYGLYKGKFLNALSVGFVPLQWEDGDEKTAFSRKFIEQELLEVSAVAIPANPNALQLGLKERAVDKSDLRQVLDLLTCSNRGDEVADPSPQIDRSNRSHEVAIPLPDHELLTLLRTIRALFRDK